MKKLKHKGLKNILRLSALALMLVSSVGVLSTEVHAGTGSGGAVGGGQGGAGNYWQAWGTGSKSAWQVFTSRVIAGQGYHKNLSMIENDVKTAGGRHGASGSSFLNVCQNSEWIWYYGSRSHGNYWYTRASNLDTEGMKAGWMNKTNSDTWTNRTSSPEWKTYKAWDNTKASANRYEAGNTIIICSGSFKPPAIEKETHEYQTRYTSDVFSGEYEIKADFIPIKTTQYNSEGSAYRAEWDSMRENQFGSPQKTEFGKWFDKNKASMQALDGKKDEAYKKEAERLRSEANAAIAKDKNLPKLVVQPTKKNAEGYNAGSAFNTVQGKRGADFSFGSAYKQKRTGKFTRTTDPVTGKYKDSPIVWGGWKDTGEVGKNGTTDINTLSSFQQYRFQQISNSNCNIDGVQAASNSEAGLAMKRRSGIKKPASLDSADYSSNKNLPLGNPAHKKPALQKSSDDEFFNREGCGDVPFDYGTIDCISDVDLKAPRTPSNSGAKYNAQDRNTRREKNGTNTPITVTTKGGKMFGAQNTDNAGKKRTVSSDRFNFFRDGVSRNARLDVWYPIVKFGVNNKNVTYDKTAWMTHDSQQADNSTFGVDPNGTPNGEMTEIKVGGVTLNEKQKSGQEAYSVRGEVNDVSSKGSWASDEGKPQKISAEWEYRITQHVILHNQVIGIKFVGNPTDGYTLVEILGDITLDPKQQPLRCEMTMNTKNPQKPIQPEKSGSAWAFKNRKFNGADNKSVMFDYVRSASGLN